LTLFGFSTSIDEIVNCRRFGREKRSHHSHIPSLLPFVMLCRFFIAADPTADVDVHITTPAGHKLVLTMTTESTIADVSGFPIARLPSFTSFCCVFFLLGAERDGATVLFACFSQHAPIPESLGCSDRSAQVFHV
jgi:hypothetical protein